MSLQFSMAILDTTGETIKTTDNGLVRIDGITVFRKVVREGIIYIEFCDNDRMRTKCRGSRFVEVPLSVLLGIIDPIQIPEVEDKSDENVIATDDLGNVE